MQYFCIKPAMPQMQIRYHSVIVDYYSSKHWFNFSLLLKVVSILPNLHFSFSLTKIILSSYNDFYYYCHWTLDHQRVPSASGALTASREHPIYTYSPRVSSLLISSVDSLLHPSLLILCRCPSSGVPSARETP